MGEWSDYFEQFPDENPANQNQRPDGPSSRVPTLAEQRAPADERRAAREALRRSSAASEQGNDQSDA